jgi:hypothetical protein
MQETGITRVFALRAYTVKVKGNAYFIAPTGRTTWSGPYATLQHATTAIARKLAREFIERDQRLNG